MTTSNRMNNFKRLALSFVGGEKLLTTQEKRSILTRRFIPEMEKPRFPRIQLVSKPSNKEIPN